MPPDSDTEDYAEVEEEMEEVKLKEDLPPPEDEDDDEISGVENINLASEGVDIMDDSKIIFEMHSGSVFSVDVAKNNSCLVVTGGEDDKAYVWNYETAQCLFECTGHTDSVTFCSFSADGKYVMTADMAGGVRVFAAVGGQCVWEYECEELEWCEWHRSANVLFAGTSSGDVYMWMIPIGACKIYASHGSKTTCAKVSSTGKEIVCGYEDGSVKKWDLKGVSTLFHYKPSLLSDDVDDEGSDGDPVLCMDLLNDGTKNGNLVVFGTENGAVTLLNSQTGKQVCSFTFSNGQKNIALKTTQGESEVEGEEICEVSHAVESVAFSPCGCYVAAGSVNGTLCIWDISLQRMRHTCNSGAGVTKLIWNSVEPNIISSGLDGVIRFWDHKKGEIVQEITGHVGNILDVVMTSDGRYILTAGDDCTARVFEK